MSEVLDDFLQDCEQRGLRGMDRTISHVRPLREKLGHLDASTIDERDIDLFIKYRLKQGRSRVTVNRETQLLGQALRLAQRRKLITTVPHIEKFREDNARQEYFERDEFESVAAYLPDDLKDFVRFAYHSGWRKSEIATLEWRHVKDDLIRLDYQFSKNREGRVLPLVGEIGEIIERRRKARHELVPLVFHREGGPVKRFDKAWRTACKKAGVADKIFHDFRRTATRNMDRAGIRRETIKSITGHKTDIMFTRYNIVVTDDLKEALEKTQGFIQTDTKISFLPRVGTAWAQRPERG